MYKELEGNYVSLADFKRYVPKILKKIAKDLEISFTKDTPKKNEYTLTKGFSKALGPWITLESQKVTISVKVFRYNYKKKEGHGNVTVRTKYPKTLRKDFGGGVNNSRSLAYVNNNYEQYIAYLKKVRHEHKALAIFKEHDLCLETSSTYAYKRFLEDLLFWFLDCHNHHIYSRVHTDYIIALTKYPERLKKNVKTTKDVTVPLAVVPYREFSDFLAGSSLKASKQGEFLVALDKQNSLLYAQMIGKSFFYVYSVDIKKYKEVRKTDLYKKLYGKSLIGFMEFATIVNVCFLKPPKR